MAPENSVIRDSSSDASQGRVGSAFHLSDALLDPSPVVLPPLDRGLRPMYLGLKAHQRAVASQCEVLNFALERGAGAVSTFSLPVFPQGHELIHVSQRLAERVLKFLLWQRGGYRVLVSGPAEIASHLQAQYSKDGARAFDARFFGKIYEKPALVIEHLEATELPQESEQAKAIGGHLDGCRIGFDAGGSDRKVAAVIDGREVFSCEMAWQPKLESDPDYHFAGIDDSIRRAAEHLPRIDAIGVSSAGIYVDNRTMVASLFRKVPEPAFNSRIKSIYPDIAKKWGGVPLEVANDGDVSALAGALSLKDHPVLGIAMGTSEAVGYVNSQGMITGWLNELAFAPIDLGASAPVDDEWSGDRGTGVNYFSQDAVIRLAPAAGIELSEGASPSEKLKEVQRLMAAGDARARSIFETLGVYLGYGLLLYSEFYTLKHVLLLGRVTSGEGGSILLEKAREVMRSEAAPLAAQIQIHLPDEATRRVGQSVAAASLPRI